MTRTYSLAKAVLAEGNPSDVKPTFNAPWNGALVNLIQMFQGSCLYILVGLLAAAAVGWAASKLIKSGSGQQVSIVVGAVCLIAAVVVFCAGGLIWWMTGITLIPA